MACATTIGLPAVSDDIDSTDAEFTVWDGIGQSNLMGFGTQVINGKGPLADFGVQAKVRALGSMLRFKSPQPQSCSA